MKKKTLSRLLSDLQHEKWLLLLSLLCAAVYVVGMLMMPVSIGRALDCMLGVSQVDFAGLTRNLLFMGLWLVLTAVSSRVQSLLNQKITFRFSRDMRRRVMGKIHKLPLKYLDAHPSGELLSRAVTDVETCSDGLLMGFSQLFTGVLTIIGTLLFMLTANGIITLLVVALTPLSLISASRIAGMSAAWVKKQSQARGRQTALTDEMISGQKTVQAFCREEETLARFDETNEALQKASLKAIFISSLTNPCTRFVNNLVYAAVALAGALFCLNGGLTVGLFSTLLNYANQYAKPFNEISSVAAELKGAAACAERVYELLDENEEVPDSDHALTADGSVTLEDVSFRYVEDRPLLEKLNLTVKPGQRVALVGPTGCGKTTLINLLMRFYDVRSGAIRVGGTDIRDVSRRSLRSTWGMVLQDTWLFAGTIRENITYGNAGAAEEEIVAAAKAAHAHSFIRRLPRGYDTLLTEGGSNLSQGQRQLLCIARMMLTRPGMLILDEATSSIDPRTEVRIQKAFREMMEGRTTFVVAHRLSTIREADTILVMKDGQVVEQGDHETLLARGGFYSTLYRSQFE